VLEVKDRAVAIAFLRSSTAFHQYEWTAAVRLWKLTGRPSPNKSIEAADELGDKLVDVMKTCEHLDHICTGIGVFLVEYGA
jgi:hypothetical protein